MCLPAAPCAPVERAGGPIAIASKLLLPPRVAQPDEPAGDPVQLGPPADGHRSLARQPLLAPRSSQ